MFTVAFLLQDNMIQFWTSFIKFHVKKCFLYFPPAFIYSTRKVYEAGESAAIGHGSVPESIQWLTHNKHLFIVEWMSKVGTVKEGISNWVALTDIYRQHIGFHSGHTEWGWISLMLFGQAYLG